MKLIELVEMAAESFTKVKMVHTSNFKRRGLSLVLPSHVLDRAVSGDRGNDMEEAYFMETLQRFLKEFDANNPEIMAVFSKASQENKGVQITVKHPIGDSVINMPCVIEPMGGNKFKFVVKTIMNKPDFKTAKNDIVIVV